MKLSVNRGGNQADQKQSCGVKWNDTRMSTYLLHCSATRHLGERIRSAIQLVEMDQAVLYKASLGFLNKIVICSNGLPSSSE
jgi:hypothetical protein